MIFWPNKRPQLQAENLPEIPSEKELARTATIAPKIGLDRSANIPIYMCPEFQPENDPEKLCEHCTEPNE